MKVCGNCGVSNFDAASFCNACGKELVLSATASAGDKIVGGSIDATKFATTITGRPGKLQGQRKADILFVLDCTGSMHGEIEAIKDTIVDFADTITSEGVRVRVGLIEFRDRLEGEEARVLLFERQMFTSRPDLFRTEVSKLRAEGGGSEPESSLDAVMLALRQPFATDSSKVIVLITDAPPHVPDKEAKSVEEVAQCVRASGVDQFYIVMRTQDPSSQVYLKLLEASHNLVFDLGKGNDFRTRAEHFKRTLMHLGKTISDSTM